MVVEKFFGQMCSHEFFLKHVLLLCYVISTKNFYFLFQSKDEILAQKTENLFALEEDRTTSVGSNFLCGRPHGGNSIPHPQAST